MARTPTRPNFFLLLGIDPDAEWDQTAFEDALRKKRNEWSRQGASVAKKALAAKQNLALIPKITEIMTDPAQREQEAEGARAEIKAAHQKELDQFEKQLAFVNAKDSITPEEIERTVEAFQHVLSPDEIRKRIIVALPTAPEKNDATAPAPQIDGTIANNIKDRLEILHLNSLYELLQSPRQIETEELLHKAEKLYTQLVHLPASAETTAKMELAGLASYIFKSAEMRTRYNETLQQAALERLFQELDDSMSRTVDAEINPKQVTLFVTNASKEGWPEQEALDYLKAHAQKHNWRITYPKAEPEAVPLVCPECQTQNSRDQHTCSQCQLPLAIDCPQCGTHVTCEHETCGKCGFPVGNRYRIDTLLKEAQQYIHQKENLERAQKILLEAEQAWPAKQSDRTQRIRAYKTNLERLISSQQQEKETKQATEVKETRQIRETKETRPVTDPSQTTPHDTVKDAGQAQPVKHIKETRPITEAKETTPHDTVKDAGQAQPVKHVTGPNQIMLHDFVKGTQPFVRIHWEAPDHGTQILLKSKEDLQRSGHTIPVSDLDQLGQRLPDEHNTRAIDTCTLNEMVYYTPVLLLKRTAYIGPSQQHIVIKENIPDISDLNCQRLGAAIRMRWTWPPDCQEALLSYQRGHVPAQHNALATTHQIQRTDYEQLGYYEIHGLLPQDYSLLVSAIMRQGNSQQTTPGMHLALQFAIQAVITYQIKLPGLFRKTATVHITVDPPRALPSMVLVSQQHRLPFRKTDGAILHKIEAIPDAWKTVVVDLPDQRQARRTFGKLFFEDDAMYNEFLIHHPGEDHMRLC